MRNIYRATYLFLLNTPTITADSTIVIIVKNAVSNERLANICPIYFILVIMTIICTKYIPILILLI